MPRNKYSLLLLRVKRIPDYQLNICYVYQLKRTYTNISMLLKVAAHSLVGDISVISNSATKVVTERKGMTGKLTSVHTAKKNFSFGLFHA